MKANTDSAMKPNTFRPIPEPRCIHVLVIEDWAMAPLSESERRELHSVLSARLRKVDWLGQKPCVGGHTSAGNRAGQNLEIDEPGRARPGGSPSEPVPPI